MYIYPYNPGSEGAKALAESLGIKRIKKEGSKFKGSADKLVINWGNSKMDNQEVAKCEVLNSPEAVAKATNKLTAFRIMKADGVCVPEFTDSRRRALDYFDLGYEVVCRTILNGHSGEGIVLATTKDELVEAPLYVVYKPKKQEYRVHVFKNKAVDIQRKARDKNVPDDQVNWKIRNHANGFIYSRNEGLGQVPGVVIANAERAVQALKLDFGAVDVIYNETNNRAYVLEVNTAPGLAGATLELYTQLFKKYYESKLSGSWVGLDELLAGKAVQKAFMGIAAVEAVPAPWQEQAG